MTELSSHADHRVIKLGLRDSRAFAEGMLDPPPVNASLQAAARRYRRSAFAFEAISAAVRAACCSAAFKQAGR